MWNPTIWSTFHGGIPPLIDYEDIEQLQVSDLVNLLSGLLPFDVTEKQALLEADFEVRVQTLIALLEMGFSNDASDSKQTVQ